MCQQFQLPVYILTLSVPAYCKAGKIIRIKYNECMTFKEARYTVEVDKVVTREIRFLKHPYKSKRTHNLMGGTQEEEPVTHLMLFGIERVKKIINFMLILWNKKLRRSFEYHCLCPPEGFLQGLRYHKYDSPWWLPSFYTQFLFS